MSNVSNCRKEIVTTNCVIKLKKNEKTKEMLSAQDFKLE